MATAEKMLPTQRKGPRPRAFVAHATDSIRPLAANAACLAFPRSSKCFRDAGVSKDMVKRARSGGEYLAQTLALIDAADMPSAIEAVLLARFRSRAEDVEGTLAEVEATLEREAKAEAADRLCTTEALVALARGDASKLDAAITARLEDCAVDLDALAKLIALRNHYGHGRA